MSVHFRIAEVVHGTKSHIVDFTEDYCIENNTIDEDEEKPTMETADVLSLKLEFEHEEQRLVREEAQKAGDPEKALQDAQLAAQPEEAHIAHEEAEVEAQRAREASEAKAQKAPDLRIKSQRRKGTFRGQE